MRPKARSFLRCEDASTRDSNPRLPTWGGCQTLGPIPSTRGAGSLAQDPHSNLGALASAGPQLRCLSGATGAKASVFVCGLELLHRAAFLSAERTASNSGARMKTGVNIQDIRSELR